MVMAAVLPGPTLLRLHRSIPLVQLRTLLALLARLACSTLLLMPMWPLSKALVLRTTLSAQEWPIQVPVDTPRLSWTALVMHRTAAPTTILRIWLSRFLRLFCPATPWLPPLSGEPWVSPLMSLTGETVRGTRLSTLLASPLRKTSMQRQLAPSSTGCATARNSVLNDSSPALT